MRKKLLPLVLPLAILLLWWLASHVWGAPALLLPPPESVARRIALLTASGELPRHAATSMARVFAGFLISASCALSLALAVSRFPRAGEALSLVLEALRVVPPLSLVPLLILWLGIDEAPKLAIVVLASFFPVYLSSLSALRSVTGAYRELARVLGLTMGETVRHILIPGAAPGILTGLRLGFGYAWRALVGAELIAAASGLGYLIEDASALARTDVVMAGILTIAVLGILCDALFRRAAARLEPGARRRAGSGALRLQRDEPREPRELRKLQKARPSAELPGIALDALTVRHPGAAAPTLDRLTLEIPAGRVAAVLGRSGCGKTTLIRAIAGLMDAQSGAVRFTGSSRPRLSMVFQDPTLLSWKTVRENVALSVLRECAAAGRDAVRDPRVEDALRLAGLLDRAEAFPAELSGGQRQRVGFARALACEPEVLLMDEPFGALDALTRRELQDESVRIFERRRMTVLMITHDVREAVRMADEAVILGDGGVAARFALALPRPRRLSDPGVGALEERILEVLMRRIAPKLPDRMLRGAGRGAARA